MKRSNWLQVPTRIRGLLGVGGSLRSVPMMLLLVLGARRESGRALNGARRYILLFDGDLPHYESDARHIKHLRQVHVLDETPELKMLLVESQESALENLVYTLPGWRYAQEQWATAARV